MPQEFDHENEIIDTECPNCFVVWSFNEMKFQECDCCGYPNHEMIEQGFFDDFDEE